MATDKNFVIKNGLTVGTTEVIDSSGNLVNTSGTISGTTITGSDRGTFEDLVLTGDADDDLTFTVSAGDWSILNSQQSNGLVIYDGTAGVQLLYNNQSRLEVLTGGLNVVNGTLSIAGTEFANASRNITAGTISSGAITAESNGNNQIHLKGTDTNPTAILMDYNGTGSTDRIRIYNNAGGFQFLTENGDEKLSIAKTTGNAIFAGTIDSGAITSTGNSQFDGEVQIGDTVNQNAYGLLQVNQEANNDESGIGILSSSAGRSMRLWVDETSSYINSGNGGAANLILNEAITVSSGGNLTGVGNITLSGTVDGVDIASRDSVLTSTTTTANAALPKAGGTMTGDINMGGNDITGIKYLQFTNEEITDFTGAYQMLLDANDTDSNVPNHGDTAGSAPFGIYFTGDNGANTTTLGSGLVKVWHTGHFTKTHIDYFVGLYNTGVTTTEFDYLDGVTSNIQTQLNDKRADVGYEMGTVDLDTIINTGLFAQNSNSQATTATNYPTTTAGILEVKQDPGNNFHTSQTYYAYNNAGTGNNLIYNRYRYDTTTGGTGTGGWSDWVRMLKDDDTFSNSGGDVTVSGTYDALVLTVADDSHNHVISNVDGLQTALDAKAPTSTTVTTNTAQTISGAKTFTSQINIGNVTSTDSSFLSGTQRIVSDGYIATQAIYNYGETGTGPAAIVFGNGSTYGSDQISLITGGVTALYIDSSQNITVAGTVDGRDLASDGSKLDGIAAGATNTAAPFYTSAITSSDVTTALGYTPYQENTALSATTGVFSSTVNIDNELRLDARGDGGSGDNVLAFKDSGGDYSIRHNVNDGNGNYSISIGYSGGGSGQYAVTGDGVGKILFGGHGRDGAISLNAAPTGTAGNNISFGIGLLVDGDDNTIRVGASANGTGMDTGAGTKVFDASGNAFATSYSIGSSTVIDSSSNLTNIGTISSGNITINTSNAATQLTIQSPVPDIEFIDSNATSRKAKISAENGNLSFEADPNTSEPNTTMTFSMDGASALSFSTAKDATFAQDVISNGLTIGNWTIGSNTGQGRIGKASDRPTGAITNQIGTSSGYWEIVDYAWSTVVAQCNNSGDFTAYRDFNTSTGGYEVGGTTVIDSSRNITGQVVTTNSTLIVGNAAISGRDMIRVKTSDNTADRGITFQNSGGAYSNSIFAEDVGGNDARLVFTGGNASSTVTSLSRDFMINNQSGGGGVSGDIHARGDVVAFSSTVSSDERLKYDIEDIKNPLDIIQSLKGRHFKWKKNDQQSSGVIAQEVEQSEMSFLVSDKVDIENPDETIKRVKYDGFIGVLIEAIKEQQKQIEELKEEVSSLRSKN
jgi:hypothetical protein